MTLREIMGRKLPRIKYLPGTDIEFDETITCPCHFSTCRFYRGMYERGKSQSPKTVLCAFCTEGTPNTPRRKIHWTNCPRFDDDWITTEDE